MDQTSQEEQEKPAKVYQVNAIHSELTAVRKLVEGQNDMLKGAVSTIYLEERLTNMGSDFDARLDLVRQEYRPVLGTAKWVARTAIGAFVTLIIAILVATWRS